MINKNLTLNNEPFLLKPVGKDYLWGGERLKYDFSKDIDLLPLAETWECSTHPDGLSIVASGVHEGRALVEVLEEYPEYLGTHPRTAYTLPILIKFIDAKKDLSVQVHPDDEYAMEHENGSLGKSEMWYVLDATEEATLVHGFKRDMDKETLEQSLRDGTIEKFLQKIRVVKDDVFFVEAGTVHAIGAGALIVEIQECSNLTYRLYDYNRTDKNGKTRELHIEKAMEVVNLKGNRVPRQPMRVLKYQTGCATELLCRCKYFQVERQIINTNRCREMVSFQAESNSFQVMVCVSGCGVIYMEQGQALSFFSGDCIFIPAKSCLFKMHGKAQILKVSC